jgi:hypothetical protein
MTPRSTHEFLKSCGWALDRIGWHKRGWCFVMARHAQAVEEYFSRPAGGTLYSALPRHDQATSEQLAAARRIVALADKPEASRA